MAWGNAPLCEPCWHERCRDRGELGRVPVKPVGPRDPEQCVNCGRTTEDGIYVRMDFEAVNYPPS